jgi:hypothetical protein
MALPEPVRRFFQTPALTRSRVVTALVVAVLADGLQWLLVPFALPGFLLDEVIDVAAMVLTMRLLGFHLLLLPTFVVELLPLADMLPTWTGCVAAVIALRKRMPTVPVGDPATPNTPTQAKEQPPIDI